MTMTRDEMIRALTDGICVVKFTKVSSGEICTIKGTLHGKLIPPEKFPDNTKSYANKDVVRLYNLDKQGWRSFRVDSVLEFNSELEIL